MKRTKTIVDRLQFLLMFSYCMRKEHPPVTCWVQQIQQLPIKNLRKNCLMYGPETMIRCFQLRKFTEYPKAFLSVNHPCNQ